MTCKVANDIAEHANQADEAECEKCQSSMTISQEGGYEVLCCDKCEHKVWADGDEY